MSPTFEWVAQASYIRKKYLKLGFEPPNFLKAIQSYRDVSHLLAS